MAWSTAKTVVVGTVIAALALWVASQQKSQEGLREQNEALLKKLATLQTENDAMAKKRSLPLYLAASPHAGSPVQPVNHANWRERWKDEIPKVTAEEASKYLKANGRTASTLLAAFRTSGNKELLKEAMQKFPKDPNVAFEAAVSTDLKGDEKRQWLEAFAKAAPDNALGDYLLASDYFHTGEKDLAMKEMAAAAGKALDEYTVQRSEDDAEVFLQAGYSLAEAKDMAGMSLLLPQLTQVKQAALNAVDVAKSYQQAGDATAAQAALQVALSVGQQYANTSNPTEIGPLVGLAIEKSALGAMDPTAPYGNGTVQDALDQITQQKQAFSQLNKQFEPVQSFMTEQDWIMYTDRRELFGEQAAMQWAVNRFTPK